MGTHRSELSIFEHVRPVNTREKPMGGLGEAQPSSAEVDGYKSRAKIRPDRSTEASSLNAQLRLPSEHVMPYTCSLLQLAGQPSDYGLARRKGYWRTAQSHRLALRTIESYIH